ncbi:type I methionyl aminopeptidase [Candidatus Microgenomates bacterium]|nr:MAG: type I methionyl aminopeptidase [Candidatus Microgenomates bacterium]
MNKINLKTPEELDTMREGGQKLGRIKKKLKDAVKPGVSALEIERLATKLIKAEGGEASFAKVPGYSWATCISVNEGVVHGIPKKEVVFGDDDIVSVDVGIFYKGFHTDTSLSVYLGKDPEKARFVEIGRESLNKAIFQVKIGKTIGDISAAMEKSLKKHGLYPVKSLVGHGVGRELHEEPMIPCFVSGAKVEKTKIVEGMALAVEVMYAQGSGEVIVGKDGWTISTKNGRMSGLFEETVAVTQNGTVVLTK